MQENINVFCRVRPFSTEEGTNQKSNLQIDSTNTTIIVESKNGVKTQYKLNGVFDADETQEAIYKIVGKPIVDGFVAGFNGTIFAYGQTGSGKSYTMLGPDLKSKSDHGIIPRAIQTIFPDLESKVQVHRNSFKYLMKCSFIEIFNEECYDLLEKNGEKLKILGSSEITVENSKENQVTTVDECMQVFLECLKQRKTAETLMNRDSSRSHAVFSLTLVTENFEEKLIRKSRLNLVDLAGSERQSQTNNTDDRLKEAGKINKSLSTLARIIRQINQNEYVSYRSSKLTRLLSDSLGGNRHVKKVKNSAKVNESRHEIQMQSSEQSHRSNFLMVTKLRKEIEDLKAKNLQAEKAAAENSLEHFELHENNAHIEARLQKQLKEFAEATNEYVNHSEAQIDILKKNNFKLQGKLTKCRKEKNQVYGHVLTQRAEINQLRKEIAFKNQKNAEITEQLAVSGLRNANLNDSRLVDHDFEFQECPIGTEPMETDEVQNDERSIPPPNEGNDPGYDSGDNRVGNDNENSSNGSEEVTSSDEEMAPVNNSYSTIETHRYGLFGKTLIVYLNDGAKDHRYHRNHGKYYYCGNCVHAKSGKSSRAEIINENGREYVRVEKFHPCELNGSMSFRDFENYEIHLNENGQKELVIFETEERKKCYRYGYHSTNIPFYQCKVKGCRCTASTRVNENGIQYIKAQWPHKNGCQPSEYIQSFKEDGFDFRNVNIINTAFK
uniref:Kinesin-like protein n=1 Tax=Panagrolaimus sp. ES5 TaxID=591445 RepID=A0AC34F3T8_9BILA